MVTWAPASLSAFTGSVSSDSSKPSAARTATRKSVSLDMMILLELKKQNRQKRRKQMVRIALFLFSVSSVSSCFDFGTEPESGCLPDEESLDFGKLAGTETEVGRPG